LRYALLRVHAIESFGSFSHDGKLTLSVLIHRMWIKQAELDPSLADLEKEGMIRRTAL
jgi:DNA-binding MarR family transcriptional regulator